MDKVKILTRREGPPAGVHDDQHQKPEGAIWGGLEEKGGLRPPKFEEAHYV